MVSVNILGSPTGRGNLKLDESCISNSKLEISDWTDFRRLVPFEISSFEFEMQDSSNFKFPSPCLGEPNILDSKGPTNLAPSSFARIGLLPVE
jgi:hypothetical protein